MTLVKPARGGARQGAGRKPSDGATGAVQVSIMLTPELDAIAKALGGGERSRGIREALRIAAEAERSMGAV